MNRYIHFRVLYIVSFFTTILSYSCNKEDDRTILRDVEDITIRFENTSYAVLQADVLQIAPEIVGASGEEQDYAYEWKVMSNDSLILSTDRDLNSSISLQPGSYEIQYTVSNKTTNVKGYSRFKLAVNGRFYQGWLVSHNLNAQAQLSFIRTDGEVFLSVASEENEMDFPGEALAAYHMRFPFYNEYAAILFFTTKGAYRFDPNGLRLAGETTDLFVDKTTFVEPAYSASSSSIDQFVVDEGGAYAGFGPTYYGSEVFKPYSPRLSGDYDLFSAVVPASSATLVYSNKEKKFLLLRTLARSFEEASSDATGVFNLSDVGKTMIAGGVKMVGPSNTFHFVFEDSQGRYLYSVNGITPQRAQKIDYGNCPEFADATQFVTSRIFQHMYYSVNNRIYHYDIVANTASLLYEFPVGTEISTMQIQHNTSKKLAIGLKAGGDGGVYLFDINDVGHFEGNTYSEHFTGFGNVVHLSYRQ